MTLTLSAVLIGVALLAFVLAIIGIPARVNLTAFGLLCWLLSTVLGGR